MPELLYAAVVAPAFVLPCAAFARYVWPYCLKVHRMFTWPWRIALGLLAVKLAADVTIAVSAVGHVAR